MGDKVRKLSSAIRLGATIHPQATGSLFTWGIVTGSAGITLNRSCALGAAVVALGRAPENPSESIRKDCYSLLVERWPDIKKLDVCPDKECNVFPRNVSAVTRMQLVAHLNDSHDWSREKIADWLEGMGM